MQSEHEKPINEPSNSQIRLQTILFACKIVPHG